MAAAPTTKPQSSAFGSRRREEEEKANSLQLPPTFFCELGTSDSEGDKAEQFEMEVRKVQGALVCMEL